MEHVVSALLKIVLKIVKGNEGDVIGHLKEFILKDNNLTRLDSILSITLGLKKGICSH